MRYPASFHLNITPRLQDPVKASQAFADFSTRSALQLSKLSLQFLFDQEALADSTQATLDALSKHISTMSKGQLLEKSVELTLYMCMPGGISRYLGGMVGIQEAATVSQVVNSITTALQAEYAHAVELAGTNMTMKQICAPFSNSIYQNLKTVETTAKIAQEEGLGVAKRTFETVENNPGLVAAEGSAARAMQEVIELEQAFKHQSTPIGSSGWELKRTKYQSKINKKTIIYGREYTGHALDSMQARGLTPLSIENTIKNGVTSQAPLPGRLMHYDHVNNITVITDQQTGRVITARFGK